MFLITWQLRDLDERQEQEKIKPDVLWTQPPPVRAALLPRAAPFSGARQQLRGPQDGGASPSAACGDPGARGREATTPGPNKSNAVHFWQRNKDLHEDVDRPGANAETAAADPADTKTFEGGGCFLDQWHLEKCLEQPGRSSGRLTAGTLSFWQSAVSNVSAHVL